jgi:hypothetical protein
MKYVCTVVVVDGCDEPADQMLARLKVWVGPMMWNSGTIGVREGYYPNQRLISFEHKTAIAEQNRLKGVASDFIQLVDDFVWRSHHGEL